MNHVIPAWWRSRSTEELDERVDVIVRAMHELWDEAELALGHIPGWSECEGLTLEQHRAKVLAEVQTPALWTSGPKPVLFDVLDHDEAAWRHYGYVQAAVDMLQELRAPPEPVLARLATVDANDATGAKRALLDGLRFALGYTGTGRGVVRAFRDTTHRLGLLIREAAPAVRVPTHPMHGVMRRALAHDDRRAHEQLGRRGGGVCAVTVIPGDGSPPDVRAVGLLKTHLDLLDLAFAHGADAPRFWYDLPRALERLGYERQSHGAFDAKTLREHHRRVIALANLHVRVERPAHSADEPASFTAPFWSIEARKDAHDASGGVHHRLLLRPGAWWPWVAPSPSTRDLPRALLRLPTDGKGHEVNRLIVRLAVEVALQPTERAAQGRRTTKRTIGSLLEDAGVATLDALREDAARRGNRARRLRTYLVGTDGEEGAFAALRRHRVADVRPTDERALWSIGPNWLERFWSTPLQVARPEDAGTTVPLALGAAVASTTARRRGA